MTHARMIPGIVFGLLVSSSAFGMQAATQGDSFHELPQLSLAQAAEPSDSAVTAEREVVIEREVVVETDRRTDTWAEEEWIIWAPVRLRSANPQATGTVRLLNTFDYSTASDRTDDDFLWRHKIIYGIAPDHHISVAVPVQLFDGRVQGNANTEFGWQWRLWDESDWIPAFALDNELFIPTGKDASGVDWRLSGLITRSLTPRWRLHSNPFLMVQSGNRPWPEDRRHPGDLRDFRWGLVTGTEYLVLDNLSVMGNIVHESSEYCGRSNQYSMEMGAQWAITQRHGLGFGTRWTLDGDRAGDNFGMGLTYSYTFNVPAIGRP